MKKLNIWLAIAALSGCAITPPAPPHLSSRFEAVLEKFCRKPGDINQGSAASNQAPAPRIPFNILYMKLYSDHYGGTEPMPYVIVRAQQLVNIFWDSKEPGEIILRGESGQDGKLRLSEADIEKLTQEYCKTPHDLWLVRWEPLFGQTNVTVDKDSFQRQQQGKED